MFISAKVKIEVDMRLPVILGERERPCAERRHCIQGGGQTPYKLGVTECHRGSNLEGLCTTQEDKVAVLCQERGRLQWD